MCALFAYILNSKWKLNQETLIYQIAFETCVD